MSTLSPSSTIRRRVIAGGAGAAAVLSLGSARGQAAFPSRPIRIVIPYGTGGGTDILIRSLVPSLSLPL